MKLVIASDLHGSAGACRALAAAVARENPDRVVLLGDLLYHGPRNDLPADYDPKSAISILNSMKDLVLCVRGNCDAEIDQMVLEFPIMAPYAYLLLGNTAIFATHGHLYDPDTYALRPGEIFLSGHTHVSGHWFKAGKLCLNPGSMGIPKGGTPAGYMTCDGKTFRWHTLEGRLYDEM